jgi:peptidoglycan/LPS O-acetylase OafA/YrhL
MAAAAVLFAAAILLSVRKKTGGEWLSREDTSALRGVMAIFILFVHLPDVCSFLNENYAATFEPFIFQGHLAVGLFFALSGYGLALSAEKGFSGFFRRRFFEVLLPYFLCNLVFLFAIRAGGQEVGMLDMLGSWFTGDPMVTYSWYVVTQLIFYVFFYIAFRCFNGRAMKIAALYIFVSVYMRWAPRFGWPLVTTRGCFCFVLGASVGALKREIDMILARRKTGLLLAVSGVLFLISHVLYFAVPLIKETPLFDCSSVFFVVFIFLLNRVFVLAPPFFHVLGKCSLEIYLYQNLTFILMRRVFVMLGSDNVFAYACASIAFAAAGAAAVHFAYGAVKGLLVKFPVFQDKSA